MVTILTILYAYSFLDLAIIALLVQPIEGSLHLSDTQMSMLLGLAFATFYAIATLPVGYLVDRYDPGDLEIAGKAGIAGDDASAVYFRRLMNAEIPFGWRGHFARRARFGVERKPCAAIGSKKNLR